MTFATWPGTFAGKRDEDEVLLDWLRDNLAVLSLEEKRATVRRLCNEFGYTARGLGSMLGISEWTVVKLRLSDEALAKERESANARARRQPRVYVTKVLRVADAWQERASRGLSAEEALRLLEDLRALCPSRQDESPTSNPKGPGS